MAFLKRTVFFIVCLFTLNAVHAQELSKKDSATNPLMRSIPPDSSKKETKPHSPKVALRRSAFIPGWGQIYNKQAWKVPIIYAALGITGGVFTYNIKWYKRTRFAFNVRATNDTANFININPRLRSLSAQDLSFYRKQFRRDVDYSVLFFIAFWGLNVADAVVFAHLKNFDVSDNLTMNINAGHNSFANTTGLTLSLDIHKKKLKPAKLMLTR